MSMNHYLTRSGLRVPDLDASSEHLVSIFGMEESERSVDSVLLAVPGQQPCVELIADSGPAIEYMTLTTSASNLAEIKDRAKAHSTTVTELDAGVQMMAPNGVAVNVVVGEATPRNSTTRDAGPALGSLDHLSLTARDVDAFLAFFTDVLDFRLSDRVGEARYWLRCNANHHTVAVFKGEDGLQHYAFEANDIRELQKLGEALAAREQNFIWGLGRHGLGDNVYSYHLDPAGAILEVCTDMLQITDDEAWEVGVWREDTSASALKWGQLPPPEFRTTWIPSAAGSAAA